MNYITDCMSKSIASSPRVTIELGEIIGKARETSNGTEFVSFTKIPYAKPPTGHLRFQRPEPLDEPWDSPLKATKKCSRPIQINKYLGNQVFGQENCLHLNVYTPDLPITENQTKLPVMIWIYGGEFWMGDASEELFYPEHLMESGQAVLVTVNYRLGPLGFLCLGDESAPGNQALWDQNMAMQWVRENIAPFGGDANNVTLVGEGSGAICVSYHILSPCSAGLFHKAICMSGTFAVPGYHLDKKPDLIGRLYATKLGCDASSTHGILKRLQEKSASELVKTGVFLKDWDPFTPRPWVPIVDADFSTTPFIPGHPYELATRGHFNKMPIIYGCTRDEGIYFISSFLRDPSLWPHFEENWAPIGSQILFNRSSDEFKEDVDLKIMEKLKQFYIGGNEVGLSHEVAEQFAKLVGDAFGFGSNELFGQLIKNSSAQPLYSYSFEYEGSFKFGDLVTARMKSMIPRLMMGSLGFRTAFGESPWVCHGDDHFYFFSSRLPFMKGILQKEDELLAARNLVKLWTNFAKTSNPTPDPSDPILKNLVWEADHGDERKYLEISRTFQMKKFDEERARRSQLWIKVLKEIKREKLSGKLPKLFAKSTIDML